MNEELEQRRSAAEAFCAANLSECAAELIEWQDTALLRDGKVRELAKLCSEYVGGYDGLKVAERMVQNQALSNLERMVQNQACERVTAPTSPASEASEQSVRDALALAWQQALSDAAFYVAGHCANGEHHAEIIMEMRPPALTLNEPPRAALESTRTASEPALADHRKDDVGLTEREIRSRAAFARAMFDGFAAVMPDIAAAMHKKLDGVEREMLDELGRTASTDATTTKPENA